MGGSAMMSVARPEGLDSIVEFAEADRSTFSAIRKARPDQHEAAATLAAFLSNIEMKKCEPQCGYIESMRLGAK